MAVCDNRVIVFVFLLLMLGCSQSDSERSPMANKLPSAKQIDVKLGLQESEILQLERRAVGGDPVAELDLAKAVLRNPASPDRFPRAKTLLIEASQKGLPEAKLGLLILLNSKSISGDGLPDSTALRNEALSTGDRFVAVTLFSSLFPQGYLQVVEQAAEAGSSIGKAKISLMWGYKAQEAYGCRLGIAAGLGKKTCPNTSEMRENAERAIKNAIELSANEDSDAGRFRFWQSLGRELRTAQTGDLSRRPLTGLVVKYVWPEKDPYLELIAEAKAMAGYLLAKGVGGKVDFQRAFRVYEMAAKLGDANAQRALGELYEGGKGTPKDFEMAARYFAQSALQGDSDGAKALAKAYLRGQGVPSDLTKAYFWLNVASMDEMSQRILELNVPLERALQFDDAGAIRDVLARRLKPEDIAEAQRSTREWRPSFQHGAPPDIALLAKASAAPSTTPGKVSKKGTGTLFLVNATGQAITNAHVVAGCGELRIEGRDGLAKIVTEDAVNDLALVQIPGETKVSATVTSEPGKLRQGEDIVVYGFPLNSVLSSGGNLTLGVVSALTGLGNNTNQIQITAPIQPGSSGSPVLNKKGEVVGVVSMKLSDSKMANATGSVGQNVNFAVNGQTLKTFLDTHKVAYRNGAGFFSRDKSTSDLADEARKWTLVVECWK